MSRFSNIGNVFFFEEPVFKPVKQDMLECRTAGGYAVQIVVPVLVNEASCKPIDIRLRRLLDDFIVQQKLSDYILWYYSPLALRFSTHLEPVAIVYDCMDELSAFKGASPEIVILEQQLLQKADLVFTGGYRLYESKKSQHKCIFPFPSSIDKAVFEPARSVQSDPTDQTHIPHPRLGFFGVLDERFDIELVKDMAGRKPGWHFVFVGPVVKIDPADLPNASNIHYLGIKDYSQLAQYISGWDICIMPFAINAATEFISPTKTPEFLAAGKRVVSTPIHDVVHPYGDKGLVGIGSTPDEFIELVTAYLRPPSDSEEWLTGVDAFLADMSWDKTWEEMNQLISTVIDKKIFLTSK